MTTNIEDIYKRYPAAKEDIEGNIEFYSDPKSYDPDEQSCFDTWMRLYDSDGELYNFLYSLSDYDGFLLKENEIVPEDYMRREEVIKKIMVKHLNTDLNDIWWVSEDGEHCKWADFHIRED